VGGRFRRPADDSTALGETALNEPEWLTDEIFVVEEFFLPEECIRYIGWSESIGYEDALVSSPSGQILRTDVRNNRRVILDSPELAEELWARAEEFLPPDAEDEDGQEYSPVGLNERLRFYRYDAGEQFDWHQDFPFEREDGARSFWTLMVYLSDGFTGGETSFDDSYSDEPFETFQVTPRTGTALCFAHHVYHKGEPVLRGRKYVLRTDVMYGPR
jgi:hypothetical protein